MIVIPIMMMIIMKAVEYGVVSVNYRVVRVKKEIVEVIKVKKDNYWVKVKMVVVKKVVKAKRNLAVEVDNEYNIIYDIIL